MNKHLNGLAVVIASFGFAAFASGEAVAAGKTRAEVRAELMAALDSGWRPDSGEVTYVGSRDVVSARSRGDVRDEVLAARDRNELNLGRERVEQFARPESELTREEVRDRLIASIESGWRPTRGEVQYRRQQSPGRFYMQAPTRDTATAAR